MSVETPVTKSELQRRATTSHPSHAALAARAACDRETRNASFRVSVTAEWQKLSHTPVVTKKGGVISTAGEHQPPIGVRAEDAADHKILVVVGTVPQRKHTPIR